MVKIAVAGANSGLALEVIDGLVEGQKHEVIALCRKDPTPFPKQPGVTWVQTTFRDKKQLVELFNGVDAVLNFIVVTNDPGNESAKLLVDAAVEAGVRRFAPSEWATGQKLYDVIDVVTWYSGKLEMQAYLREINKDKKIIEYCFFQPGLFMEYVAYPRQLTKHVPPITGYWTFLNEQRVVAVKGYEDDPPLTMTSITDIVGVVRRAIEYEGEWPEIGGITGERISASQFKQLVEKVTGKPVQFDTVELADLDAGVLNVQLPLLSHPSMSEEQLKAFAKPLWIGILKSIAKGAWTVTDEWNKLLPDYNFMKVEELVKRTWESR